jgi:hypothetical protein
MTQTFNEEVVINDNLVVDGTADETQVTVQGHSTQTEALQAWEDNAGDPLAKVTGDGRVQVGSFDQYGAMATDDSLIEAYRDEADTGKPKRGLHVAGEVENDDSDALAWSVHELTLSGASTTTGKATALSAKVATDGADLETAVGIEVAVDKESTGTIDEAVGVEVADIDQGTENFAIRTGAGTICFGDLEEGTVQSDASGNLSVRKNNLSASAAPTASDDLEDGYEVGSTWLDVSNDRAYLCLDATTGNAVWIEITQAGGVAAYASDDVSNPPTASELATAFGAASAVGAGYLGLLNDNGAGSNVYLCASDGSDWYYQALTKAV